MCNCSFKKIYLNIHPHTVSKIISFYFIELNIGCVCVNALRSAEAMLMNSMQKSLYQRIWHTHMRINRINFIYNSHICIFNAHICANVFVAIYIYRYINIRRQPFNWRPQFGSGSLGVNERSLDHYAMTPLWNEAFAYIKKKFNFINCSFDRSLRLHKRRWAGRRWKIGSH